MFYAAEDGGERLLGRRMDQVRDVERLGGRGCVQGARVERRGERVRGRVALSRSLEAANSMEDGVGSKVPVMDEASVRHAYRRWAPVYDYTFGQVAEAGRKHAVKIINERQGSVLEVGVGTGLSLPCYGSHLTITGIDLSPEMLEKARARVARAKLGNVEGLHEMDAGALTFRRRELRHRGRHVCDDGRAGPRARDARARARLRAGRRGDPRQSFQPGRRRARVPRAEARAVRRLHRLAPGVRRSTACSSATT